MAAVGMVTVACGVCKNPLQGPAGMMVACPSCGTQLQIPGGAPGAAAVAPVPVGGMMMPAGGAEANPWDILGAQPKIIVKQKVELLEAFTGFETANKYGVYAAGPDGKAAQHLFMAFEESGCCERQFCGPARGFEMSIMTAVSNKQFIKLVRPFKCTFCCLARPVLEIYDMGGGLQGSVYSHCTVWDDHLSIRDAAGNELYQIVGDCCQCGKFCPGPCDGFNRVVFRIEKDGAQVGEIAKEWSGCGREAFTDADTFSLTFPPAASANEKALMLGAQMLIDFLYFENNNNNNNGGA